MVFLDSAFDSRTPEARSVAYTAIQAAAKKKGFQCDVAVLWEDSAGRTRFIAPPQQHPFFQMVKYGQLRSQANEALDVAPVIVEPPA